MQDFFWIFEDRCFMFKIILKHIIYEMCLGTLFKGIFNNFILPKFIMNDHNRREMIEEFYRRMQAKNLADEIITRAADIASKTRNYV